MDNNNLDYLLQTGKVNTGFYDIHSFASGGKGKMNAFLAINSRISFAISNNSAQASHVVCFNKDDWFKSRLRNDLHNSNEGTYKFNNLPTSVVSPNVKNIFLTGGCVINLNKLIEEIEDTGLTSKELMIHPNAVVIIDDDVEAERTNGISNIASTMSGIAPAMCKKILRNGQARLAKDVDELSQYVGNIYHNILNLLDDNETGILESAQSLSLSIDHGIYGNDHLDLGTFYPYCTSRNIDPLSFLGQAGIPFSKVGSIFGNIRTFPIRVGDKSTDNGIDSISGVKLGSSGGCYPDHKEISWDDVSKYAGNEISEKTSLTKRTRRVFSRSDMMLRNETSIIDANYYSINFVNYLDNNIAGKSGMITRPELKSKYINVYNFVKWVEKTQYHNNGEVKLLGTGKYNHQIIHLI